MSDPTPSAHIEQAKSGRAKCRRCRQVISKGDLRLGELVDNPYGEGQASLWYHVGCAAIKRPHALLAALTDGEAVGPETVVGLETERALAEAGAAHPALCGLASIEQAPSGRARCQHCHELIEKGTLRVSRHNEADLMGVPTTSYIHLACISDYVAALDLAALADESATAQQQPAPQPATEPESAPRQTPLAGSDLRRCLRLHLIYHAEIHQAEHRDEVMGELDQLYPSTP